MCKKGEVIVMPNFPALRAVVFLLSSKNLRARGAGYPPPVGARVNDTHEEFRNVELRQSFKKYTHYKYGEVCAELNEFMIYFLNIAPGIYV